MPTGTERRGGRDEDFPREKGVRVGGLSWNQPLTPPDSSTPSSLRINSSRSQAMALASHVGDGAIGGIRANQLERPSEVRAWWKHTNHAVSWWAVPSHKFTV